MHGFPETCEYYYDVRWDPEKVTIEQLRRLVSLFEQNILGTFP